MHIEPANRINALSESAFIVVDDRAATLKRPGRTPNLTRNFTEG